MVLRFSWVICAVFLLTCNAGAQAPATPRTDPLGDPLPPGALARLGTLRFKHLPHLDPTVDAVRFSPDGKMLLSWVNNQGSLRICDAATGLELAGPWNESNARFAAAAFSPDSLLLAAAGLGNGPGKNAQIADGIKIWEIASGKQIHALPASPQGTRALVFADGGKTLIAAGDGQVRWLDIDGAKETRNWKPFDDKVEELDNGLKRTKSFNNCAISPDATTIAVQFAYRMDNKKGPVPPQQGPNQAGEVEAMGYELATGKMRWRTKAPGQNRQARFAFSADSKKVGISLGVGKLELRDAISGKLLAMTPLEEKAGPNNFFGGLALNSTGTTMAVSGTDSHVTLWSPDDAAPLRKLVARIAQFWANSTVCLDFSPDDKTLLVGVDADLQLYDVASLKELSAREGHRGWVDAIAFSKDGTKLISGSAELNMLYPQEVANWDVTTWKLLGLTSTRTPVRADIGTLSPDHSLYSGKQGADRFGIFEHASGKLITRLAVPAGTANNTRGFFSPDNRFYLLAGNDENGKPSERLYALPSGKLLCAVPAVAQAPTMESMRPVAFAPDGKLVAVFSRDNGQVHVVETGTGKVLRRMGPEVNMDPKRGPGGAQANLAFSPDGKLLASYSVMENVVRVWDVAEGKQLLTVATMEPARDPNFGPQGQGGIHFVWSPDGRTLALGGPKIRLWEMATMQVRRELAGHPNGVRALAFSPNGKLLASASKDTTILIWDATAADDAQPTGNGGHRSDADEAWKILAEQDAAKAFALICSLSGTPDETAAMLRQRLKPAQAVEGQVIETLINELDNDAFKIRQKASADLLKIGDQIVPYIDKALAGTPTLETRRRLQELRDKSSGLQLQGDRLQAVRAVEILERIGTPAARQVLQTIAAGAPGAVLTRQAQGALQRLTR
jgi:WD40 repeat protein